MAEKNPFKRNSEVRESAEFTERIKSRTDEREAIHKKTFRKWLNAKLDKATNPIEVKDLIEDLRDGHVLLTLLETLLSTKLPREKGKMRLHKLTNLSTALKVLEQNGVKIVGISNYDIADGKSRAILGLVWSIILRFQVQELFQGTKSDVKVKDFHVEKRLLSWCQDVLDGYEDVIKLKDFTVGWRNGLAFNAIIHSHKPELFEFDGLVENDNITNLQHAFDAAQNEFSVPQLLEPSDIDVPQPDKKLIMMYLTSMYDGLQNHTPTRDRKNKKILLKMEVDAYKASYSEIILYITQVETIVMSKIDNENQLENPLEEHKIAQDLTRDTTSHVSDVNDVTLKGQRLIEDGKISKMEQQEITTQIETLEIRWEKLVMLVSRYSKRSQTALVSQKEKEIQFYLVWIRESKHSISRKGEPNNPEDMKKDLKEIENLISEIETKQPKIDRELSQAKELCDDETIDSDVKRNLEQETNKLERQWHQLKEEALGKQIQLQGSSESLPAEEGVTVAQDMDNVESAPPTAMDGASQEPMAYQVQVRRLNINVKSPAVSPRNEAEKKKKLQTWKRKHDETRGAINECEIIVKKMKREHDVQLFYDQYEECNQKMRKVDPMVVDTVDHGQNILKDADMEEDFKTEVGQELENLVEDYDDLLRAVDEKKNNMDEYVKDEDSRTRKQLQNWKVTRDELKPKISNCFILLRNLKGKDVPLERVELKLHAQKIEACHQEVTSLEPEVDEVIDTGNILLRSHRLDENERRLVTSDVNEIEDQYKTIKEDSTELKMWIDSAMKAEDSQAEEQLTDWRSKRDDLKSQISKHHIVLKGLKEDHSHLEPVQLTLRAKKIEVCYQEVTSLDPEVDRFVDQSNQLLKGGKLEEEEKNLLIRDMKDVDQQYEELRKESTEMKNEVEELLENQEKKKHDLLKWREWKHDVSSKIDDVQNTVDKIKSNSTSKNLQTVQDNLLLSEECNKQIKKLEPDVRSALDFGQQLRNESPLSAEEKREIEQDMNEIQKRYDKLKEESSDQHEWLVVYLQEQETAKKDELEKWRETKQSTIILIDSCRSKLDTENTDPDIDKQNAKTKECQDDLPSIFEEVQSSLQNANSLLADDLLSKEDKDEVKADAEEISNKMRSLQSDIQNQKTRLNEVLKQSQAEDKAVMRREKLAKWTRIRNKLQSFLDAFEAKFKDVKSADTPENVSEIEERINRTAGLSEEILAVVPDIQSGYGYGNELLNDHEMDEPDKDRVENEMEMMGDGFKELRNNVNEEHQRLSDLLEEKHRERGGKYEMWKEQKEKLIVLLENAKRVVKVMKSNERPTTAEEIDEQLNDSEDVFQQMAQFLPHVKEGLSFGNHLLEEDDLSDDQKDIIEEDVENLQIEFGLVRKEFQDHQEGLKSLRADVDEVTPMEQQVSESAVDFDFKDHDMPDARDTQVSSRTVQMKHEPGEHLFVIRQNVTADNYLKRLHDEMTPEEKFEVEKQEKLRQWKDLKQRIDELLKRLMDRLNRIKAADPITLKDLIEQQEDAKECKEEVEGSEPMIRESIRLGNDLLDDDDVDEAEKERIRGYIATLEIKLRNIHHQANQEEERLAELKDKTKPRKLVREDHVVKEEPIGQQFQEREPDWDGLSKLDDKHVDVPPSPLRLNSVDQAVHLKFFEKGQDQYIMNLEDERTPEERRQAYNENKLDRWRECEGKLDDFLKDLKDRLEKVSEKPRDRDDIKKKLKDAKECREDIEEQENEIVRCLDVANEILHDDNIDEKDKDDIKAYISELEIQLKVLHRQAVHDEDRLENMLKEIPRDQGGQDIADEEAIDAHYRERPGLDIEFPDEDDEKEDAVIDAMFERSEFPEDIFSTLHEDMTPEQRKIAEEEKKLEKWRIWQHKLDSLVDRLNRRLERVKSGGKPKDRKSLHEKKDEAQDCKEEVEESEPMIRDALDHADDLLDDEHLDENEKEKIREYISEMRIKLKELHRDAYDEEERLHELLIESHPRKFEIKEDFVEEEPVEQQFHAREGIDFQFDDDHDIHDHIHPHSYHRAKLDIKFEDDEDHEVESSHEEVKRNEPTHEVFTLLFGDMSPDERKEAEKEEKVGRWRDWKDKLDDLVNRLRNKLDRAKTSDLPRDRRGIQDQREDVKDCREEVEHSEPQIRKALACANDLLDDDDLDECEKEQIRRYIASLEIDLKAIRKQAKEEEDRLDEILDQTPHPMKHVRVEHLVQEEPVDQQFSERPDWEMNLEDEHENEGDGDKIVHQMFIAKEPTHYYISRLHEDMTPEERKEAEKEEKVGRWRDWKYKLDDLVNRLRNKLDRAKTSDLPRDRRGIQDQREDVKDCREEVEHSEPQIRKALACANDLLDDDDLDESEKEQIRRYIASLEIDLKAIRKQAKEEEDRLDEILDQTPHPKKVVRVEHLVQEEPVDQQFSERPDWEMNLEDEHEKEGDADKIVHQMFIAKEPTHYYISRLHEDMTPEERREAEQEERLEDWRKWQDKLDGFVDRVKRKLNEITEQDTPQDRNAIRELRDEATECKEEIEDCRPRITRAIECANELLEDEELDDSEKEKIRQYVSDLEVELRDVYSRASEEEQRLDDLLEGTPHPKPARYSKPLAQEETIGSHHREKPGVDFNFDDETSEEHPGEFVHSMFVVRQPIHHYMWTMEDDLDDGERRDAKKEEKLDRWRSWKDKLDDMLRHLQRKLQRVQSTPKNRNDIREQRDEAKEIKEDIEESEPYVRKALDNANELLEDDDLNEEEKEKIRKYMTDLEIQLKTLYKKADEEHDQLGDLLDRTPRSQQKQEEKMVDEELISEQFAGRDDWDLLFHEEDGKKERMPDKDTAERIKMQRWFEYRDKLHAIQDKGKRDLNEIKSEKTPSTPEEMDEQLARTEDFRDGLAEVIPLIQESFEYGNKLLDDEDITEPDKDVVEKDMEDIGGSLKDAKLEVDQHYLWLKELKEQTSTTEDLISMEPVEVVHSEPVEDDADRFRNEAEKERKLSRWRSWREKLEELLDRLKNKLDRAKTRDTISSRKALKEQVHDTKACKEELDKSEAEIQEALVYAEELSKDDDLSEREKMEIKKQISEFNIQLKSLQKQADDDNIRLELELEQMDAEKSDKFSKWRKWREKVRVLLDELQGKLHKVKNSGTPKNRKVVEENIATIKECEEGLQSSAPEMQFALDYGRQLADDDILSDNEQKTVKQETVKLEKELNELKGGVEEQKTRMFHAVEQFDLQRISKLEKWNGKKRTSRLLLDRIRNKVGVLKFKLKPRNKNEIDKRMDELQDCDEELEAVEVEVASCINNGHTLLSENSLDKDSSDSVRDDVDELQEDLTKLKDDIDDQKEMLNKLSEEEDEIKKEKTARYRDWRKETQDLMDKLKQKLKRLKKSEKKEPKSKEEKKECTDLAKECSRDLDKLQEEVNDLKDYGKGMINDGSLDDQETRLMEQDLQDIDNEMDDVTKDAEIIQITLESMYEQQPSSENDHPIMEEWRERVRKVNLGLEVAEDRLDQPNELKNRNEIKERLEDIKELNIGFAESEPQFLETVDLGKESLAKDDVPDENKVEIKEDLVLMAKRWGAFKSKGEDEEDRLHELLLSTSESDDLVDWHERCDDMQAWIDDTLSLLETRPVSLSASFGNMKRQQSVTEDVLQNLVQKQLEVNTIIDEGNHLLDDPSCGTDERKDIHDKMVKLHHDWNTLSVSLTGRQESIQDALVQLEQQHKDMETTWKKKYGPLRKWISQAQSRLNSKEFAIAPDLDSVKKQRKDIEKFQAEKSSHTSEVNEALQTAEYVLKGPQVDEEEKTVIQAEMQELQHGWEELDESLTWKQNRIEDTIRKLENQREDKLRKWQEGLLQVNTWITMTTENIKPEPKLAKDVDSAYDQIDNLQDFVRDAPIYQDKVTNLNEFSSNLLADPCLGEDERLRVRNEMVDCNKQWNEFVNLANARQSRLEHNLEKLEKDQDDDFNRWTIRSGRASELLDKFESKMPTVDEPLATQLEDVEKQEREFDVFANQVDLNETQMGETFTLGEGIINDSKYSKTKKESVQGQLNLLTARWDRIKDFVDLRKGRLAETAKRLRESRRRKMEDWEYRSGEFDIFLTNCERDIRSPDTISGDLTSVKKQMDDFKTAMSKVRSQKRKVFEYGQYTDEVIADPIMDNVSRDHIKIEKEARIDRWGHIEDMMNNHQAKLKEKLQELQKGQAEMDGWNTRLVNVQTKITSLEELNSEPVGKDTDVIEKQKRQMKKANLEKESLDPQVSDFLTFSEDLMDKPGISTEDRRHIDKHCDVLELRWHKAKGELERRDKSLEEKQEVLNKRQKSLLYEWQTRKTEVSVWITDMGQRIKSQDKVAPDVDKARKQYQELKNIQREITVYEKEVRKLEDLAETLIEDPGIHSNEKGLVTSEKQSIREHWESLNTKAHNVQRKLDDRVQNLESEQNRKLQEWRKTSAPLDDWINDAETKVESYDPIAYDTKNVQQQNKENELMLKSLHKKQPKFDEVIDFGNGLLKETYVGRDDRNKIQDEMEALQERWENVDDVVAKRHDDIQVRLQELEQEEGERKKKEEGDKKRREEERRQREIEKKKVEEERKRREEERERQEEEKRRKEHEEKMRQEELERQRREEERRKREEEDERKRREEEEKRKEEERKRKEEEANKYIQMTYEPRISKPFEEEIVLQSEPELQSSPDQWQDPYAEAEAESRERLGVWRDDTDSVRRWIKQREPKLDDESDDEDLVGLKEQRKGLTKLENEVFEYRPTYDDVTRRYKLLAEDQFLNDEDKQALNEDMEDVKTRWDNMANVKEQKLKRLEGKIGQKEKGKLNDLIDCRADIKNLNDWITNKNNQFDRLSPLADDLPTLMIQREELKDFSKDIADHDPKFTECIQSANKLAKDPALSEDESDVIQKDSEKCEERWDELNEKVRLRVESVIERLPPLQRKQKELLADCDDKLERFKKSIKKSNNNLDEQRAKWLLNEDNLVSSVDLTDELIERVDQNETIEWRPTVDTSNERLAKIRVKLQRIQRDKKNRKWSFINAIKEVFGFGRKPKKTGVNIDNLIIQFEEQEDLMQEVSSLQRSANEVFASGNTIATSRDVEEHNIMKVDGEMRTVNAQWNTLNFKVLERENRLELLAKEIEDEYQEFDVWTENCETMNQFLKECERLQKDEEKIGTDVEKLQTQIKDCQEFKKEVNEYMPQAEKVFEKSQNLIDSGRLDKADIDGVEKTRDVLQNRWKGINEHLKTRQDNLDSALLDHLKKDSDSRLWKWRDDSLKLEHTLTDAHRKINSDVDETDFVAINESAEELQSLECAVDDVFNDHMTKVSDSGQDLVGQKNLEPHEEGEVHNALDTLNKRLTDIEKSAQQKKTKIKDASSKYFHRSLSNMNFNSNQMEEKMDTEFSDVGADVGEVQKQLASLQALEDEMADQDTKLEELKIQLQESKKKGLLHDDEEHQILDKISKLEVTIDRVNTGHDENKKRLTQTLIVLHEELMEEIHDWLNDTEKQVDSIQVDQNDIASLREEHTNHSELKEEISSFEPTFNRAISLSRKLLKDQIVDSERAQSYENETKSLNERMDVINLKTMDNGTKLSNGFAMYLTTRLDDAEVSLTHAETKLTQDDKGYVDLESAKKQLDISKASVGEITAVTKDVDDIVDEASALVDDGYFKKHEQEHFRARIDKIASRNKELGEQANKEYKRQFDTYIVLLRQHLGKMDIWLNKAEARRKATGEIQSGYDRIKKQLEEHQKFQDEIREHSMVTLILELDITDPAVNENVQTQVKILSERWASLWRWSEERRTQMLKLMNKWQKFRDEQLVLLNWLSSKEKVLKEMGVTDLSNEEEVAQQLEVLKKMEKQLDEQGLRLQNLHKAGDELLADVDEHDKASKDIKDQLNEFDECWNSIAKQVIDRIQVLETSQNKLREFRLEMVAVNEWMDETEQIINGFQIDMDPEEATRLQGKLDIKCDERSKYQTRVDRINRHGKDLQGTVDQPSYEAINDELEPFNKRWTKVSEQLENLSDKGYPTPENECCFIRILRRKLGICH